MVFQSAALVVEEDQVGTQSALQVPSQLVARVVEEVLVETETKRGEHGESSGGG